jgi:ATP-binding cassette subfamily B protein
VVAIGLWQLQGRVAGFLVSAALLAEAGRFLDDYVTFTELAPVVAASQRGPVPPMGFSKLRVERLSFTYPGTEREVLRDISLEIDAGEVVALVGANGSGKTTVAKLLCGLYRPSAGAIWWDGERFDLADRRSAPTRVGALFQHFGTYQLPARENVGFGDVTRLADQAAMEEAATRAGVGELIGKLPRGWDTRLSREFDDGVELSVGQWQRVALARAFFRDAPFLVLDEPTSALDPRAEADLFASLRRLYADRTVLLISHRFSSVRSADWIYVLEEGRIIEQGTHDQLMEARGRYCELFTLQAAAYLDGVASSGSDTSSSTVRRTSANDSGRRG